MGKYVIRRFLQMIPVVLGTTFIIYAMVFALPGDPSAGKCGDRACPPAVVTQIREQYNLDDPLAVAYVKYLGKLAKGDLGENTYGVPVAQELADHGVPMMVDGLGGGGLPLTELVHLPRDPGSSTQQVGRGSLDAQPARIGQHRGQQRCLRSVFSRHQ